MSNIIGPLYEGDIKVISADATDYLLENGPDVTLASNPSLEVYLDGADITSEVVVGTPTIEGNYIKAEVKAIRPENEFAVVFKAIDSNGKPIVVPGRMIVLNPKE